MDKHIEDFKRIKEMVGEFAHRIAEEEKHATASNITAIKETASAWLKLCEICEEDEGGGYGENRRYGARRRDSRGRYMTGRGGDGYGMGGGYGWMPGPYYDGPYYDGPDHGELAEELERMAQGGGNEAMKTALREAAKWIRQS